MQLFKLPIPGEQGLLRRYYFHDICPRDAVSQFIDNPTLATAEQIQDILDFTGHLIKASKLLVHCHAGISRSTAVACGILCQHGLAPNEAVRYVLEIRPQAYPNTHIVALFDDILQLDGQLNQASVEEVDKFYRNQLVDSSKENDF
jgi:predicted protein tyrosine phosphatase